MSDLDLMYRYLRARLRLPANNEDGVVSTETAVITFLLVAAAFIVLAIIATAAEDSARNIPTAQ